MARGDNCSSRCASRDHETYGECIRAKGLRVGYCGQGGGDASAQRRWDSELNHYYSALSQGVEPEGTTRAKVDEALRISDKTGVAFDGNAPKSHTELHKAVAKKVK